MTQSYGHIIDGREEESASGAVFPSIDPFRREKWADVASGDASDVDRAVVAARRAFDSGPWPRMGFAERGRLMHRWADLLEENADELALADTHDMGKPIRQSRDVDVPRSATNLRFFADHARLEPAELFPMDSGHHTYTRYEPAGVVAAIAPWNFPLMQETWKIAPALAWGNTVVLKPAEDSPASATILARLALEAGIPPGVLNVVQGFGQDSVGQALTERADIDRITFTGETATGRAIARAAAANLTPVSCELGGKGANVVFDDSDLDVAVEWSVKAIFNNAGQICLAGSRLYVQRGIYDEFLQRFVAAAAQMVVGDPTLETTDVGPLASEQHFRKVSGYVRAADDGGGRLLTGGVGEGWSVRPSVLVDAPLDAPVCREEVFGPVAVVHPFEGEADAVAAANDTPYGLSAVLFTQDLSRAHRVAAQMQVGNVWVNCFHIRDLRAPFGGVGHSGMGREGGKFSREFFTEPKAVVMALDTRVR